LVTELIIVVFYLLAPLIVFLRNALGARFGVGMLDVLEQQAAEQFRPFPDTPTSPWVKTLLVSVFVAASGAAALLWALRTWQRSRAARRQATALSESRESILSSRLLGQQLRHALTGLLNRKLSPYVSLASEDDARQRIRKLYQEFLAAAASSGIQRGPGVTPAALANTMAEAIPAAQEAISILTTAYVIARYGAAPPTHTQSQRAEEAWHSIQTHLGAYGSASTV